MKDTLEDFKNDFKDGDLLYGLSDARRWILIELQVTKYPTIDQVVDQLFNRYTGTYEGKPPNPRPEVIAHADYIESHKKYNPKLIQGQENFILTAFRRSSKAGIERVLFGNGDQRVHFYLKFFNHKKALQKQHDGYNFTNAEFRFIYREWLKNPELVDQKIIFWSGTLKKITPSYFFENNILDKPYIPKSINEKGLLKLQEWAERKRNTQLDRT